MGNRKTLLSREEYNNKFNKQLEKVNYIFQAGEIIKQCEAPYPDYWFASNKGYVFTAYYNDFRVLKPHHRYTGIKNKDGKRPGQDWYYEYGVEGEKYNRHIPVHKLMSDTFLKNEFDTEEYEIHHKKKRNTFQPNESQYCNRIDNLQLLPRTVHKELTKYASKTTDELDKEVEKKVKKSGCPVYAFTEEQLEKILINAIKSCLEQGIEPVMYTTTITDDVSEIKAEAHPIKSIELL